MSRSIEELVRNIHRNRGGAEERRQRAQGAWDARARGEGRRGGEKQAEPRPDNNWASNADDLLAQLRGGGGGGSSDRRHNHTRERRHTAERLASSATGRSARPSLASGGSPSLRHASPPMTPHATPAAGAADRQQGNVGRLVEHYEGGEDASQGTDAEAIAAQHEAPHVPGVLRSPPIPAPGPDARNQSPRRDAGAQEASVKIAGRLYATPHHAAPLPRGSDHTLPPPPPPTRTLRGPPVPPPVRPHSPHSPHRAEPYPAAGPSSPVWQARDRIVRRQPTPPGAVSVQKKPGEPLGLSFDEDGTLLEVEHGGTGDRAGLSAHVGQRLATVNAMPFHEGVFLEMKAAARVVLEFRNSPPVHSPVRERRGVTPVVVPVVRPAVQPPVPVGVPALPATPEDAWVAVTGYLMSEHRMLFEQACLLPSHERGRIIAAAVPHSVALQQAAETIWVELASQVAARLHVPMC